MVLLLLNHSIGRPKDTKKLSLIVLGFLCINMITFIYSTKGVYLIYGDHMDNGYSVLPEQKLATKAMEEALKKSLPSVFDATIEDSQKKIIAPGVGESGRKKDLETYKEMIEMKKKLLKKFGLSRGGHSSIHSFWDFQTSESYECLADQEKVKMWLLIVIGFIVSAPFGLFFITCVCSFICSPIILILMCCCKDRQLFTNF
jgi:hypothetical protein